MRELYIILGRIGWIWLGVALVLLLIALLVERYRERGRRRRDGARGFEVTASNEKQS